MRCLACILTSDTDPDIVKNTIYTVQNGLKHSDKLLVLCNKPTGDVLQAVDDCKVEKVVFSENIYFLAYNYAADFYDSQYIAILNDDVIAEPDWLDVLMEPMKKNVVMTGYEAKKLKIEETERRMVYDGEAEYGHKWNYLNGWCMLVKRRIFCRLGGFSLKPFGSLKQLYCVDPDFCFKVRRCGYDIVVRSPSRMDHLLSRSRNVSKKDFRDYNREMLYERWVGVDLPGKVILEA